MAFVESEAITLLVIEYEYSEVIYVSCEILFSK